MTAGSPAAALILAAGAGRRFGGPKAPAVIDGERLVDRAVRVAREAGCTPVVVVLGAWVGDVADADTVVNPHWESGMASSLRAGLEHLAALTETRPQRAVVTLVDLPGLTAAALTRVMDCPDDLAVATYDGVRGHPVLIGRAHWKPLADSVTGDEGARSYLARHDVTLVEVGDVADGEDLDTPVG